MAADHVLDCRIDREVMHRILSGCFRMGESVHLKKTGIILRVMPVIEVEVVKHSANQKRILVRLQVPSAIQQIGRPGDVEAVGEDVDLPMGTVLLHLLDSGMIQIVLQDTVELFSFLFAHFHLFIIQCYNIFMLENIVRLDYQDKQIWLVKTAHVSKNSIADVDECVKEVEPDTICIELDEQRYQKIQDPENWRNTDLAKVIKEKQVGFLLVNLILASFQKRMAKSMDTSSGGEMLEGIRIAKENGLNLVLADRSVKTTFGRIWAKLSGKEKIKLLSGIIESVFDDEEITEEDLAKLKEADALEAALMDIGKQFPTVKKVLVDERDQYLAQKIKTAPGKKIVAIIGAAHAGGIQRNLDTDVNIEELDHIEKKKGLSSLLKYLIPIALIAMILYTIFHNRETGLAQIRSWTLWHGGLSALGVLCALGHPLSILTAFVTAPITSLNPLLASGWFAGLVEAAVRKPKVKDFEDLAEDTGSLKGFWKNRVTRTLLVVIFANLFSTVGTVVSGIDIVRKFIESL